MPILKELLEFYEAPEWETARGVVLKRAGGKCEGCGLVDRETTTNRFGQPWRVVLACAHLNHEPWDRDPENLRAWCGRCHLAHDRPHHRETRCIRKDRSRPLLAVEGK